MPFVNFPKIRAFTESGVFYNRNESQFSRKSAKILKTATRLVPLGIYLLPLSLALTSCSTTLKPPDLAGLYGKALEYHAIDRNPVIVIPGILGSKLQDAESGRIVWGAFERGYANPKTPEGARLCALPMEIGTPLNGLSDDVVTSGALTSLRIRLLGLPLELSAYAQILGTLGAGGYRDNALYYGPDHFTCFQFPFDWRRSNAENATKLHEFILESEAYIKEEMLKRYDKKIDRVKFNIVAHSMGGLIARYYLRYGATPLPVDGTLPKLTWTGAERVKHLVMVATPNGGSAQSIEQLAFGLSLFPITRYAPAILGTFPSIYEMMPRARHGAVVDKDDPENFINFMDPSIWKEMNWGLARDDQRRMLENLLPDVADPEQRRRIALDHMEKCLRNAQQFHAALDVPASPPPGTFINLFAGDAVPTVDVFSLDRRDGTLTPRVKAQGDATVTRRSALMDERREEDWSPVLKSPIDFHGVTFLFDSHLGMTKSPMFADNVLHLLLEQP
jgi:pimeloyl-ACP methyl ester carboxylesterase